MKHFASKSCHEMTAGLKNLNLNPFWFNMHHNVPLAGEGRMQEVHQMNYLNIPKTHMAQSDVNTRQVLLIVFLL